ncbi:MAG: DUF2285 domain-containing protein [Novosphingobium sp.]
MSAAKAPALWRPEIAPGTVALASPPRDYPMGHVFDPAEFGQILADHSDETGRHLVIENPGGRLRLWLADADMPAGPIIIIIAPDIDYTIRRAAADRFTRHLQGASATRQPAILRPTDFQRQRLTFLLHLLVLLGTGLSTRELADHAVYPGLGLHGSDWRAANERRQVQRLRDEAVRLCETGYLDLLRGR